jgi:modification methylase
MNKYLNQIICGDCIEVTREMPNASVDVIITSPPYNLRNTSKQPGTIRNIKLASLCKHGYSHHSDDLPHEEYVAWQRSCLTEMLRLIKDDGAVFYVHKWRQQKGLLQDRSDIVSGFPVRQIIIWQRSGGVNFNDQYFVPTYEVIYLIAKKQFRLVDHANRVGDVWKIHQDQHNPHPAPFPVQLAHRIISSTNAHIVLDPFMGSGTTAVAAKMLDRHYIGIELSPDYCRMAMERLRNTTKTNKGLFAENKEEKIA